MGNGSSAKIVRSFGIGEQPIRQPDPPHVHEDAHPCLHQPKGGHQLSCPREWTAEFRFQHPVAVLKRTYPHG